MLEGCGIAVYAPLLCRVAYSWLPSGHPIYGYMIPSVEIAMLVSLF